MFRRCSGRRAGTSHKPLFGNTNYGNRAERRARPNATELAMVLEAGVRMDFRMRQHTRLPRKRSTMPRTNGRMPGEVTSTGASPSLELLSHQMDELADGQRCRCAGAWCRVGEARERGGHRAILCRGHVVMPVDRPGRRSRVSKLCARLTGRRHARGEPRSRPKLSPKAAGYKYLPGKICRVCG